MKGELTDSNCRRPSSGRFEGVESFSTSSRIRFQPQKLLDRRVMKVFSDVSGYPGTAASPITYLLRFFCSPLRIMKYSLFPLFRPC